MAINFLFGVKEPGKIGSLLLDANINEVHDYSNEISRFPIESGSDISDHVRQEPERLTIEGFITNSPVQFLGGIFTGDRVKEGFEYLMKYAGYDYPSQADSPTATPNKFTLVTVVTGLRVYSDMGIVRISIPRNSRTGEALRFNIELRRVRFTSSQYIIIQNTSESKPAAERINDQASSKADIGKQTGNEVNTSRAKVLFDKVNGFLGRGF